MILRETRIKLGFTTEFPQIKSKGGWISRILKEQFIFKFKVINSSPTMQIKVNNQINMCIDSSAELADGKQVKIMKKQKGFSIIFTWIHIFWRVDQDIPILSTCMYIAHCEWKFDHRFKAEHIILDSIFSSRDQEETKLTKNGRDFKACSFLQILTFACPSSPSLINNLSP